MQLRIGRYWRFQASRAVPDDCNMESGTDSGVATMCVSLLMVFMMQPYRLFRRMRLLGVGIDTVEEIWRKDSGK
ncbi:MAG TPA: hypothetical protein IAC35_03775 [Candidatus Cryptobacteroides merdipullorum]|uniref:Uncharacterized protein n=1 Tax=Candidatus Cryptobacteroides merdipullorum TaxID=2840771 RepID=A0A9D1KGR1_9BACT|nr:hypothetical protein [Candidatus Cryptobacteroides merdipullorum]